MHLQNSRAQHTSSNKLRGPAGMQDTRGARAYMVVHRYRSPLAGGGRKEEHNQTIAGGEPAVGAHAVLP
eukprot:gene9520-biopygen21241